MKPMWINSLGLSLSKYETNRSKIGLGLMDKVKQQEALILKLLGEAVRPFHAQDP